MHPQMALKNVHIPNSHLLGPNLVSFNICLAPFEDIVGITHLSATCFRLVGPTRASRFPFPPALFNVTNSYIPYDSFSDRRDVTDKMGIYTTARRGRREGEKERERV